MSTRGTSLAGGVDVTDGLLLAGCGIFGLGCVLWLGAAGASVGTGHDRPRGGVGSALRALYFS